MGCLRLLASPAHATSVAPNPPTATSAPSLATVLNPDGTLRAGAQGSFDARRFVLHTASDGRPQFSPASVTGAGDEGWQDGFYLSGTDDIVFAVAQLGTDIYVGGRFTTVGGITANHIAKWNGTTWSSLGTGATNGVDYRAGSQSSVLALAVLGTDLYVGGTFTQAGNVAAKGIAKWNGTTWSSLGTEVGTGLNGNIYSLAAAGSDLYVGGNFTRIGGIMANGVAKWNGTTWASLGASNNNGVGGTALALAVLGSSVYVGGNFTTASGISANRIAKWDGTSWSNLRTGTTGNGFGGPGTSVSALAVLGNDLYVGGNFTSAVGTGANYVAKWDGANWSSLAGINGSNGVNRAVSSLLTAGNVLYVGGQFTQAGGEPANNIAKWSGTAWSALGSGVDNNASPNSPGVNALCMAGNTLCAAGSFSLAGGTDASCVAKWDGSGWSSLGVGLNKIVTALTVSGNDVYVGGNFVTVGGVAANHVARWDGSHWNSLGTGAANGVDGHVYSLAIAGTSLYVGGDFTQAGGQLANYVAKWDGTGWSSLGTGGANGLNSYAYALATIGNTVYVGGGFTQAGSIAVSNIAKWDGTTWSTVGPGVSGGGISSLAVSGTTLYAGGSFTRAGYTEASYVAKWDGSQWSSLGIGYGYNGPGAMVRTLLVHGTDLYVGGDFRSVSTAPPNGVAKWNGSNWSGIGIGVQDTYALAMVGNYLYAGNGDGLFRWDGTTWSTIGSGLQGSVNSLGSGVHALAVGPGANLNVGGAFTKVGDGSRIVACFGIYHDGQVLASRTSSQSAEAITIYPNPSSTSFTVILPSGANLATMHADLLDALGRVVLKPQLANSAILRFETVGLAAGVYTLRLQMGTNVLTRQVVVR
jgi:hypothetical protein